jgi:replicative DNA helicase
MTREALLERSKIIEKELISRIIFDTKHAIRSSAIVSADDFHQYGEVYATVVKCHIENKNIVTELKQIGASAAEFTNDSFRQLDAICKDLKDVSNALRVHSTLITATDKITYENVDSYVSEVQRDIMNAVKSSERENTSMSIIAEDWKTLRDTNIEKIKSGNPLIGISCGFSKIDALIDGIRPGHLWILGGYTNTGKTFGSLNIVATLIKQGKRVVYYSIEMTAADIVSRILGILTRQNGKSLIKGYGDQVTAESAMQELIKSNLSIHTSKNKLSEIQFSMIEENMTQPVDFFVVDYMQLVQVKGAKEYEAMTAVSVEFQAIAKRLMAPIMLLSQVSNEGAKNGSEVVMSFKGSGAIAATADLAIEIINAEEDKTEWKRKLYAGEPVKMKWDIKKNRHGAVGVIEMNFVGNTGIFEQDTAFEDF